MWTADFREIASAREGGKAERLFRASVSAFCALTRPNRREIRQLDDLTLPLFDAVSPDTLRYVAAALSECPAAPPGLVVRLCDQPTDIAAPLLIRSWTLADTDLIALIGRHGLPHARAIARRPNLHPAILQLIRTLEASAIPAAEHHAPEQQVAAFAPSPNTDVEGKVRGAVAEEVRSRLRLIMRGATTGVEATDLDNVPASSSFPSLRDSAMTGDHALFNRSFAQALGLDVETARAAIRSSSYASLVAGLRALDLSEEQAFMVTAAACPKHFMHAEAVRLFTARYRALDLETARDRVRGWKLDMVAGWIQRQRAAENSGLSESVRPAAANSTIRRKKIRAS